jgi:hypothetical protein
LRARKRMRRMMMTGIKLPEGPGGSYRVSLNSR